MTPGRRFRSVAYQVVPPSFVSSSTSSTPDALKLGAMPASHVTDAGNVRTKAEPFVMSSRIRHAKLDEGTFVKASVVAWLTVNTNTRARARSQVVVAPTVGLLNGIRGRAISASIVS